MTLSDVFLQLLLSKYCTVHFQAVSAADTAPACLHCRFVIDFAEQVHSA